MTEGLPRPVSTEDAAKMAGRLDDLCNAEWILKRLTDGANALRTLVSERDALAVRVSELEGALQGFYRNSNEHDWPADIYAVARAALTTTSGDSHE